MQNLVNMFSFENYVAKRVQNRLNRDGNGNERTSKNIRFTYFIWGHFQFI